MPLATGTHLGPYEVVAPIGAGGMGEVYRARDTRLGRTVALKVLLPTVAGDPDRRARFAREAQTVARLSHPHICTLFDAGEHEGTIYLVLELLQGVTLADRLAQGRLPLDEVLRAATEIADALAAAHRHGIVHRDLKPGNVMLTKTGAKLLDFGLARLKAPDPDGPAGHLGSLATQPSPLTAEGAIAGTLPYMAPEQVEGRPCDARTDLWALGAILYEMLTGARAFDGGSPASVAANILKTDPPALFTRQPSTPPAVERLVCACLAKSPDDRPDTAHDVASVLRWIRESGGLAAQTSPAPRRTRWKRVVGAAVAGVACALSWGAWFWAPRAALETTRLRLSATPAEEINAGGVVESVYPILNAAGSHTAIAWAADGRALVFVGRRDGAQQLFIRRLDEWEGRPIDGTTGAEAPVVSPDGRTVAFWSDGAVKRVRLAGGPVERWLDGVRQAPIGMSWSDGGLLLGLSTLVNLHERTGSRAIALVTDGATPIPVTTPAADETAHILPCWLPGNRAFLYTARRRTTSWVDDRIYVQTVTGAGVTRKHLLSDAVDARYAGGHLVFLRRGLLMAAPFDIDRLEITGEPFGIVDTVVQGLTSMSGAGQFSISTTGHLAYLTGPLPQWPQARIVRVDRRGRVAALPTPVRSYGMNVRLDPTGRWVANSVYAIDGRDIWIYDLETGGLVARLGTGGEVGANRSWTRDGKSLTFAWVRRDGVREIVTQAADGSGPPAPLAGAGEPGPWTPDGLSLLGVKDGDIWILSGPEGARAIVQSPGTESSPAVSADGLALAYASDAPGRSEVFVRPFPGPGASKQVSIAGGESPVWHSRRRELFFLGLPDTGGRRQMWSSLCDPGGGDCSRARPLFQFDLADLRFVSVPFPGFDVSPDGEHFVVTQTVLAPAAPPITHANVVLNWVEELRARRGR